MIEFFIKGGPLMYPILVASIAGLAILFDKFIRYRHILKDLEGYTLNNRKNSPPSIMVPVISAIEEGKDERAISITGTRQVRQLERGLSWLSLIATIAPLLGLTGTVTGMIKAFMVIAESTSVNPSMLAEGIWEALITTAAGLFVAIPMHIGHHYLEKRADEIALMMKEIASGLYMEKKIGV